MPRRYDASPVGEFLAYMPADCEFIAALRVDRLVASAAYQQFEREAPGFQRRFGPDLEKATGLTASAVEQAVLGGSLTSTGQAVTAVRPRRAVTASRLRARMSGKTFPLRREVGAHVVYEAGAKDAFCVVNSRLVLYGPSQALREVLRRYRKVVFSAGLTAALKEADFYKTVTVVAAPRPKAEGASADPFKGIEGMVLQATVASDASLSLVVFCKDSAAAAEARKRFADSLTALRSSGMLPKDVSSGLDVRTGTSGRKVTATADVKVAPLIRLYKTMAAQPTNKTK